MSKAVDDLIAAVEKETTIVTGAVKAIKGFADQVLEAKDDPVRIEQVVAQMNQNADALANAVAAVPIPGGAVAQPGDISPVT